jgi:hypothetical protein
MSDSRRTIADAKPPALDLTAALADGTVSTYDIPLNSDGWNVDVYSGTGHVTFYGTSKNGDHVYFNVDPDALRVFVAAVQKAGLA